MKHFNFSRGHVIGAFVDAQFATKLTKYLSVIKSSAPARRLARDELSSCHDRTTDLMRNRGTSDVATRPA